MKKLLIILLCLPMIGFGQIIGFDLDLNSSITDIFNDGAIARYRFMINISYLYVLLLDTRFSSPKYKNIS